MTLINRADNGLPLARWKALTPPAPLPSRRWRYAMPHRVPYSAFCCSAPACRPRRISICRAQLSRTRYRSAGWSRSASAFAPDSDNLPWPLVRITGLPHACAQDIDAVITCTSAAEPLLGAEAIRPGRLVIQVAINSRA